MPERNKIRAIEQSIEGLIKKLMPKGAKIGPPTASEENKRINRFQELIRLLGTTEADKYHFDRDED